MAAVRDAEADPVQFLIALNRARVRWLLIGRQALIHYGFGQTMDYDLGSIRSRPTSRSSYGLLASWG